MRCFKLTLAYDGTEFAGWQVQAAGRTIQGVLEDALERITGQRIRAVASGRTDAGVHALGQVVGLVLDTHLAAETLMRALNAELPHDVAVLSCEEVPSGFDPIRDAHCKRYRYVICDGRVRDVFRRRYAWQVFERLDAEAMDRAARGLLGKHDFASFESSGSERASSVRTIGDIFVRRDDQSPETIVVEVEADGFLYNMVRAIVGTLVEVGRGAQSETWPEQVLAAGDRKAAGQTAPPQGLFLVRVEY